MLQMKLPPSISVPSPPLSYSKDIKFYGVANATTQFNGSESRAKVRAPSAKQRDATGQPREGVKSDRTMPHTSASLNLGKIFLAANKSAGTFSSPTSQGSRSTAPRSNSPSHAALSQPHTTIVVGASLASKHFLPSNLRHAIPHRVPTSRTQSVPDAMNATVVAQHSSQSQQWAAPAAPSRAVQTQ